jgi:hypothetical protein
MVGFPLAVCDFGLTAAQKREVARVPGLHLLELNTPPRHPWLGKSLAGTFLETMCKASGKSHPLEDARF